MPNYYDVLGCERNASVEEMKKRYHDIVRKVHPDKSDIRTDEDFLLCHRAWKTLSDPLKREEYDLELSRNEFEDMPLYSEVNLTEMNLEHDSNVYCYNCRCGGFYKFRADDINGVDEIRVGCADCTFYIRVKNTGTEHLATKIQ